MHPTPYHRFLGLLAISVMVGGLLSPAAFADRDGRRGDDRGDRSGRGDRNGDRGNDRGGDDGRGRSGYGEAALSMRTAVDMVLSRYGGQVVKAETQTRDGQMFYLIRVLTSEGTLVRVRVDALTGRMD